MKRKRSIMVNSRKRKYNIHISRAVIPSFFTIMNMFSGFMSILSSADKDYASAAWLIILAAIFDTLDGVMARLDEKLKRIWCGA